MRAVLMVFVVLSAPLSGCFGNSDHGLTADDLEVAPGTLVSGVFQDVTLEAGQRMSVFVPYLVRDPITGFVQNSTVVDVDKGASFTLDLLAPPRVSVLVILVGEHGRVNWPVRDTNESWGSWLERGGAGGEGGLSVSRTSGNSSLDFLNSSVDSGGSVLVKTLLSERASSVAVGEGGLHSSGLVHGRDVYETLFEITDPANSLDPVDGKAGYWDRWAGQGNPAYEDAAQYLISELSSFGLEVMTHRFEFTDILGNQNPESYNVCAYKW
ncbi:MAG: hypothetical protein QF736_04000, partial [Candidatus Thalassarchaeaceae archaeon]|nr:hypothetical protein [Candidatus Thalassarchaeaceae archaeon]